jgi:hypothetical protein
MELVVDARGVQTVLSWVHTEALWATVVFATVSTAV